MKNGKYSGHTLSVSTGAASVSGEPYDLGSGLVGVAANSRSASESNEYDTSGVHEFSKDGNAYAIGESVGYDADTSQVVKTGDVAKDFELGIVVKAAQAGDTKIEVMVNGERGPGPSYS